MIPKYMMYRANVAIVYANNVLLNTEYVNVVKKGIIGSEIN